MGSESLHSSAYGVFPYLISAPSLVESRHRDRRTDVQRLPERRLRANPQVVQRKMSSFGVKRAEHRLWPRPTLPIFQAIRILTPP